MARAYRNVDASAGSREYVHGREKIAQIRRLHRQSREPAPQFRRFSGRPERLVNGFCAGRVQTTGFLQEIPKKRARHAIW